MRREWVDFRVSAHHSLKLYIMAKTNLGLSKDIGISIDNNYEQTDKLIEFLESKGAEELSRRESTKTVFIELMAENLFVDWRQLEVDLNRQFPTLKTQFSEGVDDDDPLYYQETEHLEIYD